MTTPFGLPRRHVAVCASTNDIARVWAVAADPAPHGALVTADFQTHGRGRRGRQWEAPAAKSALMSFILRPDLPPADLWQLGFLTALATAEALRGLGLDAKLKWPNDVLLGDAKVAGVLVETILPPPLSGAGGGLVAIAGIGLNVNQVAFEADGYAYPPTSVRLVAGREFSTEEAIQVVAAAFGRCDEAYRREGFAAIFAAWQDHLAVGATVRRGADTALLVSLTPAGHARVRLDDGTFTEWTALAG